MTTLPLRLPLPTSLSCDALAEEAPALEGISDVSYLAEGSFARVFKGRSASGRPVAIKVLKDTFVPTPSQSPEHHWALRQFEQEKRLLLEAKSPHLVERLPHLEDAAKYPCIVMEYLEGPTLARALARPFSEDAYADLGVAILSALAPLHRLGFIHGDLKPQNIIRHQGRWVVIDLGAARRFGHPSPEEVICGSYGYMAPEQLHGSAVEARTDIYAWGKIMRRAGQHSRSPWVKAIAKFTLPRCLEEDPCLRPDASELLELLSGDGHHHRRAA